MGTVNTDRSRGQASDNTFYAWWAVVTIMLAIAAAIIGFLK
jgi:hypothetical protein